MSKQLKYSAEARRKLFSGVEQLAQAVVTTLGPKGRNVLIEKGFGSPMITKDGVTVAKEIVLEDQYESLGARVVKEAAIRTNDVAGDGTTTSTALAYAIIAEGIKLVEAGHDPMELKRGLFDAQEKAISIIQRRIKDIEDEKDILHVASISANNDKALGELIAEAFSHIGKDGVVTVEESRGFDTYVDYSEGMMFDKGYLSPFFSNTPEFTVEYEDPYILLTDEPIVQAQDLADILEATRREKRPLVIVAKDVQGDALTALVVNNSRGVIQCAATRAPSFGDRQRAMLEDLAILTGGVVLGQGHEKEIKDVTPKELGSCEKIKITSRDTVIVNGSGNEQDIGERISLLRDQIAKADNDFIREQAQERLAKLSGGVAVLHVGGSTEVELLEKKHRVEDALSATRAALESGIVPGGGTTFVRIAEDLAKASTKLKKETPDYVAGYKIAANALKYPLMKIAENAGVSGDIIAATILKRTDSKFGWDAKHNKYGNMYTMGIIDPAKVTITALKNAVSVASMFLTTECAIIDVSAVSQAPNNPLMEGGMM